MSNNLGRTSTSASQNQKEVTLNASDDDLDAAITEVLTITVDNTNAVTLTTLQLQRSYLFVLNPDGGTPPTAQITLTVPAIERGSFAVKNNTLENVLVTIAAQTETAPIVQADEIGILVTDGANVRAIAAGASSFLGLTDTPGSYAGQGGKVPTVNGGETGLEFGTPASEFTNLTTLKKAYEGAVVNITVNQSIPNNADTMIDFEEAIIDTEFTRDKNVTRQKFWLGIDLVFTANVNDDLTATAHGMLNGDGPLRVTTTVTLPAPLAVATNYWVIFVDDNTIQLATTRDNALAGIQIDITTTGTGGQTLQRANRLIVPDGVTRVKITAQHKIEDDATPTGDRVFTIRKNESLTFDVRPEQSYAADDAAQSSNQISHVLDVLAGDFFNLNFFQDSGGPLNALAELTNLSIEVVESDVIIPFPGIILPLPVIGALAVKNVTQGYSATTDTPLTWQVVTYDTGYKGVNFFDLGTDNTIITIPDGVKKARFTANSRTGAGHTLILKRDSGGGFLIEPISANSGKTTASQGDNQNSCTSAILDVAAGDKFHIEIRSTSGGTILTDATNFSIQVLETDQVLTFPGVTVERPVIGALVSKSGSQGLTTSSLTEVSWDTTEYDTGYKGTLFFDNANDALVIPAGVTKVRLTAALLGETVSNDLTEIFIQFQKNDSSFVGLAVMDHGQTAGGGGSDFITTTSPVIEVVEGDSFTVDVVMVGGTPSIPINALVNYFAIQVVETNEAAFPPEEVDFFINGIPAVSDMIFQKVASRRFSFPDELTTSQGYAVTAPSGGAVAYDVQKNGVSVGTITFADTSNTATFTTSGASQIDFDPGDRLSVHSPANLQTMADVSINIFAFRT